MSGSQKVDAVTGVITVAVAGISGSFTATDAHQWGEVLVAVFPYLLIIFLIWRISKLAAQHQECVKMHDDLQDQIIQSRNLIKAMGDKE